MYQPAKRLIQYALCMLLAACCCRIYALPNDTIQPLHIIADTSLLNYRTGENTYENTVKIDQGTTHLTADKVITQDNGHHKLQEAIAYGYQEPAHYWTTPKAGDKPFDAFAKIIRYYPLTMTVILDGNVKVSQGDNSYQGPYLVYNIKEQTVSAPATNQGRSTIIIDPKTLS